MRTHWVLPDRCIGRAAGVRHGGMGDRRRRGLHVPAHGGTHAEKRQQGQKGQRHTEATHGAHPFSCASRYGPSATIGQAEGEAACGEGSSRGSLVVLHAFIKSSEDGNVTLATLQKAAGVVGRKARVELV
jgi:hypothetical protein